MSGGRRTKLTPERQQIIVESLRLGMWAKDACARASVDPSTFYRWMQRGENEARGIHRDFRDAVKAADAECQLRALAVIQRAARDSTWQAAAWLLERRHGFVRKDQPDVWVRERGDEVTAEQCAREARLVAPLFAALASDE